MADIVLGSDVPELLVILQSGVAQKFAITLEVEPADLVDVDCKLQFGEITHVAALEGTTYTWTLTETDVAALTNRPPAVLSLGNATSRNILGRGTVEVRL
jgi:hypothetical protein